MHTKRFKAFQKEGCNSMSVQFQVYHYIAIYCWFRGFTLAAMCNVHVQCMLLKMTTSNGKFWPKTDFLSIKT